MNSTQPVRLQDDHLIQQSADGDLDAFNQLVLFYQDMAYNHARSLTGDAALAEDAVQEGFIKAFQAIKSFRGGSFRGWILRIVTNSTYDLLRRSRRHLTQPLFPEDEFEEEVESPDWLADPTTLVQHVVEEKEFSQQIYKMLDELPYAYRSVIHLIDVQEFGYEEAAQVLKLPLGTVKSRLARARIQMQHKLSGNWNHAGRIRSDNTCLAA